MKPYPLNHADRMLSELDEHAISGGETEDFSQFLVQQSWQQGERLNDLVAEYASAAKVLVRYKAIRALSDSVFRSDRFRG